MATATAEPPQEHIRVKIEELKQFIWNRRPILGEIMQKHGGKMLSSYAQDFLDVNATPALDTRKEELITMVEELVAGRINPEVAKGVAAQLRRLPLVSTADHHAPIDHPFWVNANIISGIPAFQHPEMNLPYLIAFSFASVSVNNASGFSRGILFNGGVGGSKNSIRLPIIADKLKMSVVFGLHPYTREDLTKAEGQLMKREKEGEILAGRGDKIRSVLEEFFAAPEVLGASNLCSQICRINYKLWPRLFHGAHGVPSASASKVPNLVYLDIETLVGELLLRHHLKNPQSLIYQLLFEPKYRPLILKHFNNLSGSFSLEKGWGTYLFWGLDEKMYRLQMKLDGERLISAEGVRNIPWTPEGLWEAIDTRKIFPSMFLCYVLVSLYSGMKCLGGFCQVHDLTVIKEAWKNFLLEIGQPSEAASFTDIQTKELGGDGMVLAYMKTQDGGVVPATGIDMLLSDDDTSFERYAALSERVTLSELMNSLLPEMYVVLSALAERNPAWATMKPEDVLRATGVEGKLMEAMISDAIR